MKVYISGQKRGVTDAIKRDLRRRSAVEPVIGHTKSEHRMGRNFLKGVQGDATNAVLAAAGYNFSRILAWLAALWRALIMAVLADASDAESTRSATPDRSNEPPANATYFTVDYLFSTAWGAWRGAGDVPSDFRKASTFSSSKLFDFILQEIERSSMGTYYSGEIYIQILSRKENASTAVILRNFPTIIGTIIFGARRARTLLLAAAAEKHLSERGLLVARINFDLGILSAMKKKRGEARGYFNKARVAPKVSARTNCCKRSIPRSRNYREASEGLPASVSCFRDFCWCSIEAYSGR